LFRQRPYIKHQTSLSPLQQVQPVQKTENATKNDQHATSVVQLPSLSQRADIPTWRNHGNPFCIIMRNGYLNNLNVLS
jgi:hypothetical protein